eukprot:scaffold12559_cov125-Isochrysis_galbana.AAC.13
MRRARRLDQETIRHALGLSYSSRLGLLGALGVSSQQPAALSLEQLAASSSAASDCSASTSTWRSPCACARAPQRNRNRAKSDVRCRKHTKERRTNGRCGTRDARKDKENKNK